ncbi:expressed unknown protein [Seminavis robusta]|uniref:Uncharacterized protein n=1 Tax=Seminavis robusta TaxID=568900 RepID=A0A9N8DB35_9STRA|nr:expressed unknown protein [Seminavis robusta]|eukprot:Sro16_g011910.1 n/a (266) ;mRNA; r:158680-159477
MTLEEEPQFTTIQRRRSLKGDSIRSLREHLEASLSSRSLQTLDDKNAETNKKERTEITKNASIEEPRVEEQRDENEKFADRHADQVRSRLLHQLGIQKQLAIQNATQNANASASNSEAWGPTTELPLNDAKTSWAKQPNHRQLQFHPTVTVHPIPSYKVYSKRIQRTIWTNAQELQEQVTRNALEFNYEQWDANKVLDEDNGLLFHDGEWIHPVHVEFTVPEGQPELSSEEELWILTCHRLGIQPAAFYHSLSTGPPPLSKQPHV